MKIYRMITKSDWEPYKNKDHYVPIELETDGFIHFSFKNQLVNVANAVYKDFDELLVLEVDTDKLLQPNKLQIEDLYGYEEEYPHLYGTLNLSAVISEFTMDNTPDGFKLNV